MFAYIQLTNENHIGHGRFARLLTILRREFDLA